MEAERELEPLRGAHGSVEDDLGRGHGDSASLQYKANLLAGSTATLGRRGRRHT